jgi:hypothetical protein
LLVSCLTLPAWAAKKKPCEDLLTNTSIEAEAKVVVPKGDLIYYYQKEGIDPFNFFQEGMDPANENPLRIANEQNGLDISIGGGNWENGKDGKNLITITALAYSAKQQRYLIDNSAGYRLLVNVDPKAGLAHVYMQEQKKNNKWLEWELAAIYSADPKDQEKGEDEDDAQEPARVAPANDYSDLGLMGDGAHDDPQLLMITTTDTEHNLVVYNGSSLFDGVLTTIVIPENVAAAIASGELKKLDGVTVTDKSGATISFKVDGSDYQQRARVRAQGRGANGKEFKVQSCNPWKPAVGTFG